MNKKECKDLLSMNDRCSCGGIFEIICENLVGDKYYYLKCNKCGNEYED